MIMIILLARESRREFGLLGWSGWGAGNGSNFPWMIMDHSRKFPKREQHNSKSCIIYRHTMNFVLALKPFSIIHPAMAGALGVPPIANVHDISGLNGSDVFPPFPR